MSTNININVKNQNKGLIDQLKLQQLVARTAHLEKESRIILEREASAERTTALATQGLDAQGNVLSGRLNVPAFRRDEPAAQRRQDEYLLLRPHVPPIDGKFATLNKGFSKFIEALNTTPEAYEYEASAGPNNTPAIKIPSSYVTSFGSVPFSGSSSKYKTTTKDFTFEVFVRMGDTYKRDDPSLAFIANVGRSPNNCLMSSAVGTQFLDGEFRASSSVTCAYLDKSGEIIDVFNTSYRLDSSPVQPGSWHHYAVTKQDYTLRFFIDGKLTGSAKTTSLDFDIIQDSGNRFFGFFGNSGGGSDVVTSNVVRFHGYRFHPKALYTSSFTPPSSF